MPRGRPYKCIYCGSAATVSKGVRVTKTLGIRKIRRCNSCGRKFTPQNQKLIPVEGDQANEAQTKSVSGDSSDGKVADDPVDSTESPQAESVEMTQQLETAPVVPEESLPADQAMMEVTESEQPTDGH